MTRYPRFAFLIAIYIIPTLLGFADNLQELFLR